VDRIIIRNQCPLCCTAHRNGRARLCDRCTLKAWAVNALGVLAAFGFVAFVAGALYLWN
jgi:hypothetical protein